MESLVLLYKLLTKFYFPNIRGRRCCLWKVDHSSHQRLGLQGAVLQAGQAVRLGRAGAAGGELHGADPQDHAALRGDIRGGGGLHQPQAQVHQVRRAQHGPGPVQTGTPI